ncbi:MAG: HpcH/HpaI aldolase/citrate lyase family protein [Notoacmeibacter sp.]
MSPQRHDAESTSLMTHRSWLFVPGDSLSKLAKIAKCGADAAIIDLEDSVTVAAKAGARSNAAQFLQNWQPAKGKPAIYVRVNALESRMTSDDLRAAISPATTGIMLPKSEGGQSVTELAAMIRVAEAKAGISDGQTKMIAIATETARSVLNAGTYAKSSSRLEAMAWGAEDLSADIGALSARDSRGDFTSLFAHARTMLLLGAANATVAAIDGIYPDFRDEEGLQQECANAFRDGFSGKMAIHPAQIATINAAFTPSIATLNQAKKIISAFANAGNSGVISLDGKMLDRPHLKLAERMVSLSSRQNQ